MIVPVSNAKRLFMPKTYHNRLIKGVMQFGLIQPGDSVLVGFSGGKDSAFLLYALKCLRSYGSLDFNLGAVTVDLGFEKPLEEKPISDFCEDLGISHSFIRTKAYDVIMERSEESPCAWCSYFRRATINSFAVKNGFNKVAYAHHMDDAIETLLMNMLYSGRGGTFLPLTKLERSGIEVIRPLIYFEEKDVTRSLKFIGFKPVPSPCPFDEYTARAKVKAMIKDLHRENKMVRPNLEAVVRSGLSQYIVSEKPKKGQNGHLLASGGTTGA